MDLERILQQHPEYAPDIIVWEKLLSLFGKEIVQISSFEDWQTFIHRHPDVAIDPDLARRIFTIQSLLESEETPVNERIEKETKEEKKTHATPWAQSTDKYKQISEKDKKEQGMNSTEETQAETSSPSEEDENIEQSTEQPREAEQHEDDAQTEPLAAEETGDNSVGAQQELTEEERQQQLLMTALTQTLPQTEYHLPTDQLRKDPRYQAIKDSLIEKKRQIWKQNHPGQHWTEAFNDPEYNQYFSPDLTDHANRQWTPEYRRSGMPIDVIKEPITQLSRDAIALFRQQYAQDALAYDRAERDRIYTDDTFHDPLIVDPIYRQYVEATSQAVQKRMAQAKQQWEQGDRATPFDEDKIAWIERYKYAAEFARRFPKKAQAYAERDASIQRVLQHEEAIRTSTQEPPVSMPVRTPSLFQKINHSLQQRRAEQQRRIRAAQTVQKEEEERKEENDQQSSNRRLIEELRKQQQRSVERQLRESVSRETPRQIPRKPFRPRTGGFVNRANKLLDTARTGRSLLNKGVGNAGKNVAGRAGSFLAKQAAAVIARTGATAAAATSEFWGPIVIVILLIIVAIIVIILLLSGQGGNVTSTLEERIPGLTLQKAGPAQIENKQDITYTITVDYAGPLDVTVFDPIPPNTTLASASGNFKHENNTISWRLRDNTQTVTTAGARLYTFTITLRPLQDDIVVRNRTYARAAGQSTFEPLKLAKKVNREHVAVGEHITFTISVQASYLAGETITVTEDIPASTSFVNADNGGQLKGNSIEWVLTAEKGIASTQGKVIPPAGQDVPEALRRPVQRISATTEQIRTELERAKSPYAQHAQVIYDAGVKYNVDPAFLLAVWKNETAYGARGGAPNNPGSIVFVRPGYLGMNAEPHTICFATCIRFATFPSIEQGLEAMAALIAQEYYPRGQTDSWTIHSGLSANDSHAYHCRCHIGPGYPVKDWASYINFYYAWIDTLDQISGGGYGLTKELTFVVQATTDKTWITNTAHAFAPGAGNIKSKRVIVKVGDAPESERPKTGGEPAPPPNIATLKQDIQSKFGITMNGYGNQYLVWAWERFHEVNGTNFFDLTKGTVIEVGVGKMSSQRDCPSNPNSYDVLLSPYNNERMFKTILIHELGHVIRNCNNRQIIQYVEHEQAYAKEYGVSYYANNAYECTGSDNLSEDYADMVLYYLDPVTNEQTAACAPRSRGNPNLQQNFPLHYNVANTVLGDYP